MRERGDRRYIGRSDKPLHLRRREVLSGRGPADYVCPAPFSMLISLQEAAGFVSTHYAIFDELWRRKDERMTEADLLAVIGSVQNAATPAYLLTQLKRMKFLVEADAEVGVWELAPPFARWIEHLQQISRPVSSARIRGQLAEIDHNLDAFRVAEARGDLATARELLRETRSAFQLLIEDLGQTRAAIATAVSEAKSEHRRQSAVERFRRINRFWTEYLIPMLDLLDPAGPMEVACTAWENQLALSLEKKFIPERLAAERIETEMRILRVTVRHSFRSCRDELEPLHARLRRESLWTDGAARVLQRLEREGVAGSVFAGSLPVSTFRFVGQIAPAALLASAAQWRDFSAPPSEIDFAGSAAPADSQDVEDILAAMEVAPTSLYPLDDLLAWLAQNHGQRGFNAILQVFSLLVTDARYRATFRFPIAEYAFAGGVVRCGRVKLTLRSAA